MGILGRAWKAIRGGPAEAKGESITGHPLYSLLGLPNASWTPRNYLKLADEGYCKNTIAHRCVDAIAKGVSQPPILLYRVAADGTRREVHDHPVAALLRRPNPRMGRVEFMYTLAAHLAIGGNGYVHGIGPSSGRNAGRYTEAWLKRPDRMSVVPHGEDVAGYRYSHGARTEFWQVDPLTLRCPIRHIKLFNPLDDHHGLSPISVAGMDVDLHNETRTWNKRLLDNAARPEGVLSTPKRLTDIQFSSLRQQIDEQYAGAQNAGRPMLLEDGLEWNQISFSPRDLDFLQARLVSARDICAAFDVPPMLLGIPGDSTYNNQREARMAFFDTTVVWYLDHVLGGLQSWLLGDAEDLVLGYDLDTVPAMAYRREQLFDRAAKGTFLKIDEQREMAGWGKLDGDTGQVLLVPNTVRPLEQALEPPEAAPSEGADGDKKPKPKPKPKPGDRPANDDGEGDADPPKRAANDKAVRPALIATLKAAREELGGSETAFALWLAGEGLAEEEAAALARLTGRADAV